MGFIKTWVGECSAWECDDLGHLNMRYYMHKAQQARQMFIIKLGLDNAFHKNSASSVRVRDFHIKYLGEARPGDPLRFESGLLELGEDTARICHIMYHHDGRLAATIHETVEHYYLPTRQSFAWPRRVVEAAKALTVELPAPAKARNIDMDATPKAIDETRLKKLGVNLLGMGVFQPHECGIGGTVTTQSLLGRTTETIATFDEGWPEMTDQAFRDSNGSGALLEARCFINQRAVAGQAYHFYSGVQSGDSYTRRIIHNMVDAVSGENLFSMDAVGCLFDLNARKLIKATPAQIKVLEKNVIKGLSV